MSYELSRDVLRVPQLGRELSESENRVALATAAASVGMWSRTLPADEFWASEKWRELFGFTKSERVDFDCFMRRLHPDDREGIRNAFASAIEGAGHYDGEYRAILPSGEMRWIASSGRVEFTDGTPTAMRGASLDITQRKQAEEAANHLSGRLIHAQEAERTRLARELHDDLNQNLALLAIELDILGQKPPATGSEVTKRMQELSVQVRNLSSSVHRLSHELHPVKLEQLGLVAALRGLCRELGAAHRVAIEFAPSAEPRLVPDDIALCVYRIVQEGLQNVINHSGSTTAKVELMSDEDELRLVVSDQGCGFDSTVVSDESSLGFVSMRERVRLVRGQVSVQSRKGEGTQIKVQVPLGGRAA